MGREVVIAIMRQQADLYQAAGLEEMAVRVEHRMELFRPKLPDEPSAIEEMYDNLRSLEFKADSAQAIKDDLAKPPVFSPG